VGKQGTGRRREEYRSEQLSDRRTLERNVSGVSGAADVGGRLWRLCGRGRFGRHEKSAHDAAIRRIEQAGAVSLTALQVLLEFQRDWARKEHYEEVIEVVKEHCGAYGQGVEYAATMVQKAPASRNRQISNTK
jgi:hypothetical protein